MYLSQQIEDDLLEQDDRVYSINCLEEQEAILASFPRNVRA